MLLIFINLIFEVMKNYHVILTSLVDPVRDSDLENPETKDYRFDIEAENEAEAVDKAKEIHSLSVWESDVYEN
jgi:hypothetical protein